jgi:hypothetical protein
MLLFVATSPSMSRYDTFSHEVVPRCCVHVLVFTVPVHAFLALLSSSIYRPFCFFLCSYYYL